MLAGGASRRLGGVPKGLEDVGGARIIDRVVAALHVVVDDLVLLANDPAARHWLPGVPCVGDLRSNAGGLAGVEAALASRPGRDILVVAWDMPFVEAALLRALVAASGAHEADIVLPASPSPHGFEPFCALYSTRTRASLAAFLDAGGGAAHEFVRAARVRLLSEAEVAAIGNPERLLFSVNAPGDLARARAMADAGK